MNCIFSLIKPRPPRYILRIPVHSSSQIPQQTLAPCIAPAIVGEARRDHGSRLTGYAWRLLRDLVRAGDVVQDTFLALARQPADPDLRPCMAPWLFAVCRRKAVSEIRRCSRLTSLDDLPELTEPNEDPARALVQSEDHRRVLALVDRLPAAQREVVRLRFQEDFSYEEIATVTERSVSHVGVLLHQAMHALRRDWRDLEPAV